MDALNEIPTAAGWYDERWAIAIGGVVLAALAATVYKAVAAGMEGALFGRGKRIARLEASMTKVQSDIAACRVAEVTARQEIQSLRQSVEDHEAQLKRGELFMQKIDLHLEEQSRASLRMEAMLGEIRQDLTNHLLQHGKI